MGLLTQVEFPRWNFIRLLGIVQKRQKKKPLSIKKAGRWICLAVCLKRHGEDPTRADWHRSNT
jgi:hypothetical protein